MQSRARGWPTSQDTPSKASAVVVEIHVQCLASRPGASSNYGRRIDCAAGADRAAWRRTLEAAEIRERPLPHGRRQPWPEVPLHRAPGARRPPDRDAQAAGPSGRAAPRRRRPRRRPSGEPQARARCAPSLGSSASFSCQCGAECAHKNRATPSPMPLGARSGSQYEASAIDRPVRRPRR